MRRFVSLFALAAASLLLPQAANALQTPPPLAPSTDPMVRTGALVAPPGEPALRHEVATRYGEAPRALHTAWNAFLADTGDARWTALWDTGTRRPLRVFGGSIPAAGASNSPSAAEKHARDFLSRHAGLFLAGLPISDFDLTVNDDDRGLRTVGFQQMVSAGGVRVPVVGGRVNVRFKADRLFMFGSEALPVAPFSAPEKGTSQAETAALDYLAPGLPGAAVQATSLVALPLIREGRFRVALAWQVATESDSPASLTDVFVDARDGKVLATRENLRFLTGALQYTAPLRGPQEHGDFPADTAHLVVDGAPSATDATGQFTYSDTATSLACFAASDTVNVFNAAGAPASLDLDPAALAGPAVWSMKDDDEGDAQLSAFVHTSIAKAHARAIDPTMPFLGNTLQVRVNQDDPNYICNAFWNGSNLNFFVPFQFCSNTARVADVVYHEFGHAFHTHTILPSVGAWDSALGEGGADYYASIITGDPYLGPGFYTNGDYLRQFESDYRWPQDIDWDPHETGLIFAGAMWDLRTILEAELGADEGPALAHQLYRGALRRSPNIPATYAEVLATDDDDGDLGNGTPHICEILKAFTPHGLSPYLTSNGLALTHEPIRHLPGQVEPYEVRADLTTTFPECGAGEEVDEIRVQWHTQGTSGYALMKKDDKGYVASVPGQVAGAQLKYYLAAQVGNNESYLPQNPADPEYKAFVGETIPLYCTDFEQGADDWTFGETTGKATDFVWGPPHGAAGDPEGAYSGVAVIGTTVNAEGAYRKNRQSFATGPVVELGEHTHVRLELMRWLTIEDGYFDQASILVNGMQVWQNKGTDETDGTLTHQDLEWRFEDIDISNITAGGNHTAQVTFQLTSDDGVEYGGWNIDDVCIVAWEPPPPDPGTGGSGGSGGSDGSGGLGEDNPAPSCACRTSSAEAPTSWALFGAAFGLATFLRRRNRHSRRA